MKFSQVLTYLLFCLAAGSAFAADNFETNNEKDNGTFALSAQSCEKINAGEEKSTIRVRVTDKASFLAVSRIEEVKSLRNELNEHDFNVLVYSLVDNSIEDMTVRTTKQNSEELCVEVNGYLQLSSIFEAIAKQTEEQQNTDTASKESMTDIVSDINQSYSELPAGKADVIPPTEEAELAKYRAPESDGYQPVSHTLDAEVRAKPVSERAPRGASALKDYAKVLRQPDEAPATFDDKRGLVYVEPTEFFDKSRSVIHAKTVKDIFAADESFYITDNKDLADYIIKTKVLRAKVDPINSSTGRLQMVVAVEAEFPEDKSSVIEHRNRMVVFSKDENEQEVAFKLMKKLFTSAGEQIKRKVDQAERRRRPDKALPDIITPAASRQPG